MASPTFYATKHNFETTTPPLKRAMIGNRQVAYAAHSVVKLVLGGNRDTKPGFSIGDRASPRRHQVEGHFVRFDLAEGCEHGWEDVESEDGRKRWRCRLCGGRMTWKQPHERGDAGKGFVTQEYLVTT